MRAALMLKRILLVTVVLATTSARSASAVAPVTVQIVIDQFAFSKAAVSVTVGDTVEWLNKDIVDHTSTEKTDKRDGWNVTMAPGKTARVRMTRAGTFDYYCRFHPNMMGRVVVAAAAKDSEGRGSF